MRYIFILLFTLSAYNLVAQNRLIHVYVALCDNEFQGIVPVPESIGDGTKPSTNLYWGAGYGVYHFFNRKSQDWTLIEEPEPQNPLVLARALFKHCEKDIYLLADAYEGQYIQDCTEDFLRSANGQYPDSVMVNGQSLVFGGGADLLAYVGHNGLMDFEVEMTYKPVNLADQKEVMILGCYSKSYFAEEIKKADALPLLWTTHLMAPEAYTLHSAIEGWVYNESGKEIEERAAQVYHQYQKCGIRGARNLFATGF